MNQHEKTDLHMTEAEFKRRLLAQGLLTRITPPARQESQPRERRPVPVLGNAVSETVTRERR